MLHYNDVFYYDTLYHHGVKGMHWGVRRYQNEDGTLTKEGQKRYRDGGFSEKQKAKINKNYVKKQMKKAGKEHSEKRHTMFKKASTSDTIKLAVGKLLGWGGFFSAGGIPVGMAGNYLASRTQTKTDTVFANRYLKDLKTPTGDAVKFVEKRSVLPHLDRTLMTKAVYIDPKRKGDT